MNIKTITEVYISILLKIESKLKQNSMFCWNEIQTTK
jgi:hypothetical protein